MNQYWVSVFVSWMPFVALIVVWILCVRFTSRQRTTSSGLTMIELYEQQIAETRRTNATLEKIAAVLDRASLK